MNVKASAFVCIALTACSGQSKSSTPTGPYQYQSTEAGVTIDSTLKVRYDADAAVVDEDVQFGHVTANVEYRLDPKTFSAIAYAIRNDPEGEEPSISISANSASVQTKTGGRAVAKAPVPGAPSWVFGNYASSFIMLPSLVRATHAKAYNAYMPSVFHGKAFTFKLSPTAVTEKPPAGVPANDAAIALGSKIRAPRAMVTVWYDPGTSVVDAVNIAGGTAFIRKP